MAGSAPFRPRVAIDTVFPPPLGDRCRALGADFIQTSGPGLWRIEILAITEALVTGFNLPSGDPARLSTRAIGASN